MPAPTSPKKTSKGLIFVIVLVGAAVLAVDVGLLDLDLAEEVGVAPR